MGPFYVHDMGGVWFVVNIKSVHTGVLLLYGSVLCTWVWFGYVPLIFAQLSEEST